MKQTLETNQPTSVSQRGDATRRGSVPVPSGTVTAEAFPFDEAVFLHLASEYWDWKRLFDTDSDARILQHPDHVLADLQFAFQAARHPASIVFATRDGQRVAAAILLPKTFGGEAKFGPAWKLHGYYLAGGRLLGEQSDEAVTALFNGIQQHQRKSGADFVLIEDLDTADPLLTRLNESALRSKLVRPATAQKRHRLVLPASVEEWWMGFTSKTRNTLRRKMKTMSHCRLERITQADQVPDFLEQARAISEKSWQSDLLGLRVHNNEHELQTFSCLAMQGALRCYLLWQDDVPLSFCIGTQHRDLFFYEEVAYDRDFARSSPGQVLVLRMIEDLFAHEPPKVFDFGGGDAEYKRQLANSESESGPVWILRPGLKSHAIKGYLRGRQWLSRSLRAALSETGLLQRLRQWSRRGRTVPDAASVAASTVASTARSVTDATVNTEPDSAAEGDQP